MKTSPSILTRSIATALLALAARTSVDAQTNGTWTNLAGGSWPTTTNWSGGTVAAGTDALADFSTLNITANATVTLDGARTVGQLKFGDATTASNDWILNTGSGGPLTLDVSTGQATINVVNRTATIGAVLAGADGINVTGNATGASGTVVLNAVNTFTGGLTITGAITQLNNASGAGSNTITVATSANTSSANKLAINGGVAISNNIIINANASPLAGQGAVQAVGTGQATVNGTITINGNTANGGHLVGGAASGNELVLNGVITAAAGIQVAQRDGRVIYKGGGTGYTSLGITGTAIVGANDGIATTAVPQIALSGAGTLDVGAFNQALAGITFAATATGTVTGTTGVLTLNGPVSSSGNFTHNFNSNVDLAGGIRNFTVGDGSNAVDLQVGAAFSNGTVNKLGAGTLALNGNSSAAITLGAGTLALNGTNSGAVTANGGTLGGSGTVNALTTMNAGATFSPGTNGTSGTFTTDALTFSTGSALVMNVGTANDLINVTALNGLTTSGTATVKILTIGGPLQVGTTTLINHSGPIQGSGLGGFILSGIGHATATLQDTGTAVALNVTQATDGILWTGATNNTWDTTAANQNWKFQTGGAATSYLDGDDVRFADLAVPAATSVNVAAPVTPSRVSIDNSAANPYTFTGSSITGPVSLTKNGVGTAVFQNVLGYTGATTISGGTLEMDFDTGGFVEAGTAVGTSGISIAGGATLRLTRDDGDFTFDRSVSGTGTVLIDPHTAAGTAVRAVTISGANTGFTGMWKLSPSNLGAAGLGSFRTVNTSTNQTTLGPAAIDVDAGAQLWIADNTTLTNNITITGTGYAEAGGGTPIGLGALTSGVYLGTGTPFFSYAGIGAIRMGAADTLSGSITVDGNSKIMAFGQTGTISGNISSTSATDTLFIGGGTSATTVIFTGTNTYGKTFVNGGSGTSGVIQTLQIGNGGSTGTLGSGEVVLYGDSAATGRLVFQRGDAYSLAAGQNVTGAASATANLVRTSVVVNNTGAGLTLNDNNIDLSDGSNGGNLSVAGTGNTIGVNGSVLNILGSSLVDVGQFFVGDANGFSGTVNQAGTSTVNFLSQMRLGHWPNETGTYNFSGGSLNALLAPTQFPFQTTGTQETNGGIYVGIDGQANLVQSGGAISTNFVVLDNRADTGAGAGMGNGFDSFTQTGGTLILKNAFGIISRNFTTAINLNGGTIQAAAGISPALDTNKITVLAGGATLDTNGANTFTLYGPLAGTGIVSITNTGTGTGILKLSDGTATANAAGGTMPGGSLGTASVNIAANTALQATRTTGVDTWSGNISGSGAFSKQGAGTVILTGSGGTFTGTTTISGGRLDLPTVFASPTITVADGAAVGGEPTVTALTLGAAAGGTVFIDPVTSGVLTATNLTLNGTTSVDFASPAPSTTSPITVLKYTNLTGASTFALANAGSYRPATFDTTVPGTVTLNLSTKDLTWTGAGGPAWDVNSTTNWNDTTPAAEKFFYGDRVTFGDGPTQVAVTVTSGVSPWKTTVNSATNNYTFTSASSGIAGPGSLEKSGASTLTLSGPNTYSGKTVLSGGTIASATLAASLGNAAATNTIELSGGARLSDTGAVAFDFGPTRSITVGSGGGSISHNNTTAAAITISGKLIGGAADTLSFHSAAAGAGTFILTGDNSGYTGKISVDAQAAGLTALRLARQSAVPAGGSITLNYPAAGANGNATTIDLPGVSLPVGLTLNLTSFLNGAISLRTQITSNGDSVINGPITLSGTSIIQISPGSGTIAVNGNITETAPGSFNNILFGRGAGTTIFNGTINLPTAGSTLAQTDAGTLVLNSTGNTFSAASALVGTFRLGANDAIPTSATLNLGQNDGSSPNFNLNGFNQTLGGLVYTAGTGGTKTITNSAPALSTLTLNQTTDVTMGGVFSGNLALTKGGPGNLTMSNANSSFIGNLLINGGTVTATALSGGTNGTLGRVNLAGRSITLNNASTLAFTSNNIFGNGVNNANLPSVTLNEGSTLTSTRYNVLGAVSLNGATLTQSATDSGNYEGFQFKGSVTVGGSTASLISTGNGKANHLDANTVFNVGDATASSAVDLVVSTPLRNQSGDFGNAVGGLTKSGAGTMELSATNTYTGNTVVNAGVLLVTGSIGGSSTTVNSGGTLGGNGTVGAVTVNGGALSPGTSPGTLTTGALSLDSASLLKFELAQAGTAGGGVNDLISTGGNLTLDGTLQVTELAGFSIGTYRLFDYTGSLTNNILNLESSFLAAHPGSFVDAATPGQVNLAVVPEPGAFMSLLGGFGMLLGLRRLRRTV